MALSPDDPALQMPGLMNMLPVPMGAPEGGLVGDAMVTYDPSGDIHVDLDGEVPGSKPSVEQAPFDANLAEFMEERDLLAVADKVIEWVDVDLQSRSEWETRLRDGMELLGIAPRKSSESPFVGASEVTHPMITEAALQFCARAIDELQPATGPAKAGLVPDATPEVEKQGERVEDYMNYYLTQEDEEYFDDYDRMLFVVALHGDGFRKLYRDPVTGKPLSRFVEAIDLIVPYSARNLQSATRYTHKMLMDENEVRRAMQAGMYRTVELGPPPPVSQDENKRLSDEVEARSPTQAQDDNERTLYECHCNWRLKGVDKDDEPAKPYIATVDKDARKVLALRRNWKEDDQKCIKRVWFVQYPFLRGLGFYNLGFFHILGQLAAAAGGITRAIIDGAAIANVNGGFKPKMGGNVAQDIRFKPGVFQDIDLDPQELKNAFFCPPFKEPGPAIFQTLELLTMAGQRLATTTEASVGNAKNTGPVGTTIALIDQSQKVFSAIHKRMHKALAKELRLLAELFGEDTDAQYPYFVDGAPATAFPQDFSARIDVFPVSDPSISSSTQRIATAQATLELVMSDPSIYDVKARKRAHKAMLRAMKVPQPDEYLPDEEGGGPRVDPVTENMLLGTGKPTQAYPDQAHEAHMAVHMQFMQTLPPGAPPEVGMAALAHLAEHYAYNMRNQYAMALQQGGMQMPQVNLADRVGDMDPQIESQIAVAQAQVAQMLMQQQAMAMAQEAAQQPGGPADPKLEQQREAHDQKQGLTQESHAADQARKDEGFAREQRRKDAQIGAKISQEERAAKARPAA